MNGSISVKPARTAALWIVSVLVSCAVAAPATAGLSSPGAQRAAWLLDRGQWQDRLVSGAALQQQDEFGSGAVTLPESRAQASGRKPALYVLASLALPGSGEAMLGYKRGYFMMAADIFAWTQVIKNDSDGNDLRDEYYAYADAHWSEGRLVEAYNSSVHDYLDGIGLEYFDDVTSVTDVSDLEGNLPLWVSREADEREYYENLGKWDQFVFGWDDFRRPDDPPAGVTYVPTSTLEDLRQSWTSPHRDEYRKMRDESNDAFKTRDRWLYVNIGLRVLSVVQTAYLGGMLGGGPAHELEVSGHPVRFIAQPAGWGKGALAAAVRF